MTPEMLNDDEAEEFETLPKDLEFAELQPQAEVEEEIVIPDDVIDYDDLADAAAEAADEYYEA